MAFVTVIFSLVTYQLGSREEEEEEKNVYSNEKYLIYYMWWFVGPVVCSVSLAKHGSIIGGPPL